MSTGVGHTVDVGQPREGSTRTKRLQLWITLMHASLRPPCKLAFAMDPRSLSKSEMAFNGRRYSGGSSLFTGNNAVSSPAKINRAM